MPELNALVVVDGLGVASLPGGGRLVLAGMAPEVAERRVLEYYRAKIGMPALRLSLEASFDPRAPIRFLGAVERPGSTYPCQGLRLLDVLEKAGLTDMADTDAVEVRRLGGVTRIHIRAGDPNGAWNIELQGGDRVFVPQMTGPNHVFVLGAVFQPGTVPFTRGLTVRQAIGLAGGAKSSADLSRVEILRREVFVGSIDATLNDVPVRPGDTIRILAQDTSPTVLIVGGVVRPGRAPFREGLTLYAAIQEAGGLVRGVPLGFVKVVRTIDGRSVGQTYDLREIIAGRVPNPVLREGDRIEVPEPPSA